MIENVFVFCLHFDKIYEMLEDLNVCCLNTAVCQLWETVVLLNKHGLAYTGTFSSDGSFILSWVSVGRRTQHNRFYVALYIPCANVVSVV